jgi:hypothetical protein
VDHHHNIYQSQNEEDHQAHAGGESEFAINSRKEGGRGYHLKNDSNIVGQHKIPYAKRN